MNYLQSTGKSIQDAFEKYHELNPQVYNKFKDYAFKAINAGKKKISFKLILNTIRWEIFMQTEEPQPVRIEGKKVAFRINDAYGSRYARLFIKDYPDHEEKIDLRLLRS